jgi:hypothetical protein
MGSIPTAIIRPSPYPDLAFNRIFWGGLFMFSASDYHCDNQNPSVAAKQLNEGDRVFEPKKIKLRLEQILRMQGYKGDAQIHPEIRSTAEAMAVLAEKTFQPAVHYTLIGVSEINSNALILDGGAEFHSLAFEKYLAGCSEIALFIMTLGKALDDLEAELASSGKLLETLFLETAGWLGIEQLTKHFSSHLRESVAADGLRLGRRMSPGYSFRVDRKICEWPLEDQKLIFQLFGQEKLSVEMLESCAMSPKMSRSGLYGLVSKTNTRTGR